MVCLYSVAIEPGNYAGDSRLISATPSHAALNKNPKPRKIVIHPVGQVLTPVLRVTPDPEPELRLISEGRSKKNSPTPDKGHPKQIKNRQIHILLGGQQFTDGGKAPLALPLTPAPSNT